MSQIGEGPDLDVPEEPPDVARAALEILDHDVDGLVPRRLRVCAGRRGELQVVERGDLARQAVHRQEVRAVSGRLDEQNLLDERQQVPQRRARLRLRQHHDPRVVRAELDLVLGEDHPVRELPANLALLELEAAGENRSWERDRDCRAGAKVPGAADDLARLALPHIHPTELQAVGVRVLLRLEHFADAKEAEVAVLVRHAPPLDPLDLGRGDREPRGELVERHLDGHIVAEPGDRDSQNCLSTRRSPSQRARMSGKSNFSCATRSIPQPKANPDHSSGSTPTFSNTRGSTMPAPPISSQPE